MNNPELAKPKPFDFGAPATVDPAKVTLNQTVREALDAKRKPPKVDTEKVRFLTDIDERNMRMFAVVMLMRQLRGIMLYKQTVPAHVKAERRRKNKVAKHSRKINRRG